MFAFKMLRIFFSILNFTVVIILCVKFENLEAIRDNFTSLEVEESSGEKLEIDKELFNTYVNNWEETDDDFLNVTDYSDNLNNNEHIDNLNLNDSSTAFTDEWTTDESFFGTTEKYEFVPDNSTYHISNNDVLSRWLEEEKEEMESVDFEDYDSSEKLETFTAKPELNENKTINFRNNGKILNVTVVADSDEDDETTTVLNRQNLSDKKTGHISRQYFGIIWNSDGIKCLSFNFTFDVFLKDAYLNLLPVAYVEGNCDSSNNFIKFKWLKADNNRFNVTANFKIECGIKNCFVNGIDIEVEDIKNGKHFSSTKENLHLFESKPGDVYKNASLVRLEMTQNLRISLSNVTFYVAENLNLNELKLAQGGTFGDYYVETIACVIGFIVLISFTIYIIYILRKIKKSKGDFIPSST